MQVCVTGTPAITARKQISRTSSLLRVGFDIAGQN